MGNRVRTTVIYVHMDANVEGHTRSQSEQVHMNTRGSMVIVMVLYGNVKHLSRFNF